MFLLIRGSHFLSAFEEVMDKARVSFFALRMLQVLVSCLMVGHSLGVGLYLFQKAHYGESCMNEENALYGEACKYRDTWIQFLIYTSKLPDDVRQVLVYMRLNTTEHCILDPASQFCCNALCSIYHQCL